MRFPKQKNNANELPSTGTMTNDIAKYMNNGRKQ